LTGWGAALTPFMDEGGKGLRVSDGPGLKS